jgi:hypothetical protein
MCSDCRTHSVPNYRAVLHGEFCIFRGDDALEDDLHVRDIAHALHGASGQIRESATPDSCHWCKALFRDP